MEKKHKNKILDCIITWLYNDIGLFAFSFFLLLFTGLNIFFFEKQRFQGKLIFLHDSLLTNISFLYFILFLSCRLWFAFSKKRYCYLSFGLIWLSTCTWAWIDVSRSRGIFQDILLYLAMLLLQILVFWFFARLPVVYERRIQQGVFQSIIDENVYNLDLEEYARLDDVYHFSIDKAEIARANYVQHEMAQLDIGNAIQVRYIAGQLCTYTDEKWKDEENVKFWKSQFTYYENRTRVLTELSRTTDCLFAYLYVVYLCDEIPKEINIFDKIFILEQLNKKIVNQLVCTEDVINFFITEMDCKKNITLERKADILKEIFDRSFCTEQQEKELIERKEAEKEER